MPLEIEGQVAPGRLAGLAGKVFDGKVTPPSPQMGLVRDDQLAMVAQIARAAGPAPDQGAKDCGLDSRTTQGTHSRARQAQCADAIDHQSHPHPGAYARNQAIGDFAAQGIIGQDKRADVEPLARPSEDLE